MTKELHQKKRKQMGEKENEADMAKSIQGSKHHTRSLSTQKGLIAMGRETRYHLIRSIILRFELLINGAAFH
jgi:hypothetical protein